MTRINFHTYDTDGPTPGQTEWPIVDDESHACLGVIRDAALNEQIMLEHRLFPEMRAILGGLLARWDKDDDRDNPILREKLRAIIALIDK